MANTYAFAIFGALASWPSRWRRSLCSFFYHNGMEEKDTIIDPVDEAGVPSGSLNRLPERTGGW